MKNLNIKQQIILKSKKKMFLLFLAIILGNRPMDLK